MPVCYLSVLLMELGVETSKPPESHVQSGIHKGNPHEGDPVSNKTDILCYLLTSILIWKMNTHSERERDRQTDRQTETERERETEREGEGQRQRQSHRDTHRERDRDRETETETETVLLCHLCHHHPPCQPVMHSCTLSPSPDSQHYTYSSL